MTRPRPSYRCSELPQLMHCSGSHVMRKKAKPLDEHDNAARDAGLWGHYESATTLVDQYGAVYTGMEPRPPAPRLPADFKPSGYDRWKVRYYLQTIDSYVPGDYGMEVEAEFSHAFEHFDLTGHGDNFAINAALTEAVGFDFKNGTEPVDMAAHNAQVTGYIVLLRKAYPTLKRITYVIVQPANDEEEGYERVSRVCVEGTDLDGLELYLERELNRVTNETPTLDSDGDGKQCWYCPAKLVCPAYLGDYNKMKMTLTYELLNNVRDQPDFEGLVDIFDTGKKFADLFDKAGGILKYRLTNYPGQAIEIAGRKYSIVSRNSTRTIVNNEMATAALSDLPDELFHTTYKFKPGEIEEALATYLKIPKESKKKDEHGNPVRSGKTEYVARLGAITDQARISFIKVS